MSLGYEAGAGGSAVKGGRHAWFSLCQCYVVTMVRNGRNPPKISSLDMISQLFPGKFEQSCIYFRFQGLQELFTQNLLNLL